MANVAPLVRVALLSQVSVRSLDLLGCSIIIDLHEEKELDWPNSHVALGQVHTI